MVRWGGAESQQGVEVVMCRREVEEVSAGGVRWRVVAMGNVGFSWGGPSLRPKFIKTTYNESQVESPLRSGSLYK